MDEIKELPKVPDASGIFQFDAKKKTLLVPISAVEGLEGQWEAFAMTNDCQILPYKNPVVKLTCVDDWEELVKTVHHAFECGFHCNDMTPGEVEDDIESALDRFAKKNGLPAHDWDTEYEALYENSKQVKIDWSHFQDDELKHLMEPCTNLVGAEFARCFERELFKHMLTAHVDKIYVLDDFVPRGTTAMWDFLFKTTRPDGQSCREYDFSNLVQMGDAEFDKLVKSLPASPNEELVREWRREMKYDT